MHQQDASDAPIHINFLHRFCAVNIEKYVFYKYNGKRSIARINEMRRLHG